MEISITEYAESDFAQVFSLLNDVYNSQISKETLEKHYLSNNKKIFVAKDNKKVVGCAFLEIKEDYIRPYKYGYVTYVAVDTNQRKKGIGKCIFEKIISEARENGCSAIELTSANSRTGAHEFYSTIGFSKKSTTVFITEI